MAFLACVGGPLHREFITRSGKTIHAPNGDAYYELPISVRGSTQKMRIPFYVHESLYHDRSKRQHFAHEAAYQMTWEQPDNSGYYWIRWYPSMDLSIVHAEVEYAHALRVVVGKMPDGHNPKRVLWSMQCIPQIAAEMSGETTMELCQAADWCDENDHQTDAELFRKLAKRLKSTG